jgi:acetyl esterase/lipase
MSITTHAITAADAHTMAAVRAELAKVPTLAFEPGARAIYDQIIGQAPAAETVRYEPGEVGGVPGWWCRPARADAAGAVLYLHGGGYVLGSAAAYRNFVGQIAARAGAPVFIADYALAPERPYPAAADDVRALYRGLLALGFERIALCGDSAGGGLALALLATEEARSGRIAGIAGIVAMSPWIDLSVSGDTMTSRAAQDPLLSKATLADAAARYLAGRDPLGPGLATLGAELPAGPPVRIHVGDAEVLLADSLRFARKADAAGLRCEVHVWEGMLHVFPSSFAILEAAAAALADIGDFLAERLRR